MLFEKYRLFENMCKNCNLENEYEVIGAPIIGGDTNPSVYNPLHRPEISYKKAVIFLLVFVVMEICIFLISGYVANTSTKVKLLCCAIGAVVYILIIGKRAMIWGVHVYQHYAPDRVRLKCAFEPSCSEYMILALNKYGFIVGTIKGIGRLLRCKAPGGVDYP